MIRLAIAASSAVVRAGLESLAGSSPELDVVDAHPDVILASAPLEDVPAGVETPVVLIAEEAHPVWTAEALRMGVRAILSRDASQAEIVAAIVAAANGLASVDPREMERLLSSQPQIQTGRNSPALTTRELEVLRSMADGEANKVIAYKLGISDHTVKFHVASILAKLGAGSRTEAVAIGMRSGLILL